MAMLSSSNRGLSAVRPEIKDNLGCSGFGKSFKELKNLVPYLAVTSFCHLAKSSPPGPVAPAPRNHGSTMKSNEADGHLRNNDNGINNYKVRRY